MDRIIQKVNINFNCTGRPYGYYADVDFGCRVFHICDNYGRRIPMHCPVNTLFNQMYRVCDWAYNVDCELSPAFYYLNENNFERESTQNDEPKKINKSFKDP